MRKTNLQSIQVWSEQTWKLMMSWVSRSFLMNSRRRRRRRDLQSEMSLMTKEMTEMPRLKFLRT